MNNETTVEQRLYDNYRDPKSATFLETDPNKIYLAAKTEASHFPVSHGEITKFKETVESISRGFERRVLRARQRRLQYRSWLSYSPLDLICADLCFLPPVDKKKGKKKTILVLLDAYSRLIHLSLLPNATSKQTIEKFEQGLRFFGANETLSYTKFTSDRG